MQLLIVHDDAEVGEQLSGMVADYTEHACDLVENNAAAQRWAQTHAHCELLLAHLEGPGVDGLSLGGSLSEIFPGLQVLFLPAYPAAEQRLEIAKTKIFPEPIDGERLLNAIAHAEAHRQTGMDLFHALDVLQMCCLSGRSGAVQLVKGSKTAIVYLLSGRIVHAERGTARGAEALYELVPWDAVEFAYDYSVRAPVHTIKTEWHEAIIAAVARRKAQVVGGTIETAAPAAPPKAHRWFSGRN